MFLCLVLIAQGEGINNDELTEDEEEEGIVEEDLSDYIAEGDILCKTLWKLKYLPRGVGNPDQPDKLAQV